MLSSVVQLENCRMVHQFDVNDDRMYSDCLQQHRMNVFATSAVAAAGGGGNRGNYFVGYPGGCGSGDISPPSTRHHHQQQQPAGGYLSDASAAAAAIAPQHQHIHQYYPDFQHHHPSVHHHQSGNTTAGASGVQCTMGATQIAAAPGSGVGWNGYTSAHHAGGGGGGPVVDKDSTGGSPEWPGPSPAAAGLASAASTTRSYGSYRDELQGPQSSPLELLQQQLQDPDRSPPPPPHHQTTSGGAAGSGSGVSIGIGGGGYAAYNRSAMQHGGKYQPLQPEETATPGGANGSHVSSAVKRHLMQSPSTSSAAGGDSARSAGAAASLQPHSASWSHSQQAPYDWMKKQTYPTITPSGKTRTKDKYRIVYSELQKVELEKEFLFNQYITIQRKAELATAIGLSDRQVKIWFQNRRAKERKSKRKSDDSPRGHAPAAPGGGIPVGSMVSSGAAHMGGAKTVAMDNSSRLRQQLQQQQHRFSDVIKIESVGHAHDLMTSSLTQSANLYTMNQHIA